jgi:hypothetical protein
VCGRKTPNPQKHLFFKMFISYCAGILVVEYDRGLRRCPRKSLDVLYAERSFEENLAKFTKAQQMKN